MSAWNQDCLDVFDTAPDPGATPPGVGPALVREGGTHAVGTTPEPAGGPQAGGAVGAHAIASEPAGRAHVLGTGGEPCPPADAAWSSAHSVACGSQLNFARNSS